MMNNSQERLIVEKITSILADMNIALRWGNEKDWVHFFEKCFNEYKTEEINLTIMNYGHNSVKTIDELKEVFRCFKTLKDNPDRVSACKFISFVNFVFQAEGSVHCSELDIDCGYDVMVREDNISKIELSDKNSWLCDCYDLEELHQFFEEDMER